jgi:hypothetical protein
MRLHNGAEHTGCDAAIRLAANDQFAAGQPKFSPANGPLKT